MTRRSIVPVAALALFGLLAGCGSAPDTAAQDGTPAATSAAAELSGEVTVLAAASLTEVFDELGADFEQQHPGVTVTFSYAGSSDLAAQILNGAPADVFAAASPKTMKTVTDAKLAAGDPTVFVTNTLQIAIPKGNPGNITGLADFADASKTIALCAEEVPCGAAAKTVFADAGITPQPDTLEKDVKAALTKVELDEVDAALVYKTDVIAAGDKVEGIDFPEAAGAVNDYPIALLSEAPNAEAARAFIDFVLSADGTAVLKAAGFGQP